MSTSKITEGQNRNLKSPW